MALRYLRSKSVPVDTIIYIYQIQVQGNKEIKIDNIFKAFKSSLFVCMF
jgi:hypothetical protein